jgi:hypothetical protein
VPRRRSSHRLVTTANFFVGWADALTFGGYTGLMNWSDPNYLRYIDRNSMEYNGGTILGTVHSFVIGAATTGGACTLNWAGRAARVYSAVETGVGMANVGQKIANGEQLNVWDAVAFAPALGALSNRAGIFGRLFECFVGETQVAVGWSPAALVVDTTSIDMAGLGSATDNTWSMEWIVSGTVLLGAAVVVRRMATRRLKAVRRVRRLRGRGLVATGMTVAARRGSGAVVARGEPADSPHPADALFRPENFSGDWREEPHAMPMTAVPASHAESGERIASSNTDRSPARWLWLAPLLLALGCLWQGLSGSARREVAALAEPSTAVAGMMASSPTEARSSSTPTLLTRRIDELRIGSRVIGANPLAEDTHRTAAEPLPASSRVVRMRLPKDDRNDLVVELLRPTTWIVAHRAVVGDSIWLDLPEFGAAGWALVEAVDACPPLEAGSGSLVTGRFVHSSSRNLRWLWTEAEREPTGVTGNHRYWSATRGAFVEVDELAVGEELDTATGRTKVRRIEADPADQTVYNLEIHGEHVYRVGAAGVLVHNQYHHIVSPYANLGRGFTQPWTQMSQSILRNAGININSRVRIGGATNVANVVGHEARRHAEAYHKMVFKELADATGTLTPGTAAYTSAVQRTLRDLELRLTANPGLLDGVGL